jgi:multidrug efflux pump subunit AcrA (membrane-fusion protein)
VLQGELDAVEAHTFLAPRTPQWNVAIKWMVEDGSTVQAGDPVVEFDSSGVGANLRTIDSEERELQTRQRAEEASERVAGVERTAEVQRRELALERARILAEVDEGSLSRRTLQERRLDVRKAEVELGIARDAAEAGDRGEALVGEVAVIDRESLLRRRQSAEGDLLALTLRAPTDGIVQVADHPWEPRRLDVGDDVGPGTVLARLPDLRRMQVKAALWDVDDGAVQVGQAVVCVLDAWPERPFAGTIREVSPLAREPYTGSTRRQFLVWVDLQVSDPEIMRPGISVRVEVQREGRDAVLTVPRAALRWDGPKVLARTTGGADVEVELGLCDALVCEVRAGLQDGDLLDRPW